MDATENSRTRVFLKVCAITRKATIVYDCLRTDHFSLTNPGRPI